MIVGIVAIARNYAIGKNGKLPWHYSPDLKFFKETTLGSAVVMGRVTYESIGKPLPNRLNIVLSRASNIEPQPDLLVLKTVAEIARLARYLKTDVYVIGGAQTYAEFAREIEKWIVTEIPETVTDADALMPADFLDGFEICEEKRLAENLFVKIYERKK